MKMTKDQWDALSGKAQWDIMSAMRGPDTDSEKSTYIKRLTTAVLRGVMQDVYRVGGAVVLKPKTVIIPEGSFEEIFFGGSHFFIHVLDAANVMASLHLIKIKTVPIQDYISYINGEGTKHIQKYVSDFNGSL